MTIDEAIMQCEEAAEDRAKLSKRYDDASGYSRSHNEAIRTNDAKECEKCSQDFRQLAGWLKELKQLREQTRWIPVSEKLPEEGEEVLVSAYDTYGKKVIIARYQGEKYGFTCGLVSAWMPLPKAYREVKE